MRRSLAVVVVAALLAGTAGDARGQEYPPRWWHLLDIGIYAGGAFGSPWFESRTVTLNPTPTPAENGRPFAEVHPTDARYAAGADWYINNDVVRFGRNAVVKYGLVRVLRIDDVTPVGEYRGVTVFAEAGTTGEPEVIYLPVRPGCEFQPYMSSVKVGGVRG